MTFLVSHSNNELRVQAIGYDLGEILNYDEMFDFVFGVIPMARTYHKNPDINYPHLSVFSRIDGRPEVEIARLDLSYPNIELIFFDQYMSESLVERFMGYCLIYSL